MCKCDYNIYQTGSTKWNKGGHGRMLNVSPGWMDRRSMTWNYKIGHSNCCGPRNAYLFGVSLFLKVDGWMEGLLFC